MSYNLESNFDLPPERITTSHYPSALAGLETLEFTGIDRKILVFCLPSAVKPRGSASLFLSQAYIIDLALLSANPESNCILLHLEKENAK